MKLLKPMTPPRRPKVSFPASIVQRRKRTHPSHASDVRRMQQLPCVKPSWKENCVLSWMSRRRLSSVPWTPPFHQCAHAPGDHLRTSALPVASSPTAPFYPPLSTLVLVWPSTRLPWPPLVCVFEGGDLGPPWTPDAVRNGTDLPRGWRPGSHQRHGARPRPWGVQTLGWSATGNYRCEAPNWQLTPPWCLPSGRMGPGWRCIGGSTKNEGAQVPRVGRQRLDVHASWWSRRNGGAVLC